MSVLRRIHPLHVVAVLLLIGALAFTALNVRSSDLGVVRTGSVYDETSSGAAVLRRYFNAAGVRTSTVEGDRFAIDRQRIGVLFVLGASELYTPADAEAVSAFVRAGGTVVVATELGLFERALLDAFDVRVVGVGTPGTHALANVAFADPPARRMAVDRAGALAVGTAGLALATDGRSPIVAMKRQGRGSVYVVGSLGPFLASGLGQSDNGRFVLGLAADALRSGTEVAFDEYHHGFHPTTDVLVLLQRTWPGRALVFASIAGFLYLVLSGRRLGPPVPLDPRPARSSLEFIRGFAGLVRRSGRGEIARRRLRRDLRGGLARRLGLDPDMPFDRVLVTLAATDRERAAEARAVDDALGRRLREDQLLRTVAQIERLVKTR
ncbi:MAG TPA: DUF4350 domain-containing protein [Candidatus Limnocylindria bacterium]|nr:DUF4350 domain-containing protein [Candidatus Limnocylindria bacterium]